ncbi:MAG TPA: universal stress protein, partial [Longimicrobiales bacterium]
DAIREYAAERGFDLIAMATHGRAGLKRILFGSVSDRVKRGTTVPILLLQPEVQHGNGLNLADIN